MFRAAFDSNPGLAHGIEITKLSTGNCISHELMSQAALPDPEIGRARPHSDIDGGWQLPCRLSQATTGIRARQ